MGVSGTKEWSKHSANCLIGCSHDCRYGYARFNATERYGYAKEGEWATPRRSKRSITKARKPMDGTVMFPTTHDILPEFLSECMTLLGNILRGGNRVLVVSKPHRDCIDAITREFAKYRDHMLFRFSIGASDEAILRYWEPGAPSYSERRACLALARERGFGTSVSMEPMLDSANVVETVDDLRPHVTDSIWLGKMNCVRSRVKIHTPEDEAMVAAIERGQTDQNIMSIHTTLCRDPLIRWKESIKKVVGIEIAEEAGLDV
jgi:DNA repair photolyase